MRDATASVDGVETVDEIRMRWHGHRLLITITAAVDSTLSVGEGHRISQEIVHSVIHEFPCKVEAVVHIDPAGLDDAHALTEHHR